MKSIHELHKIRKSMSSETKQTFIDGAKMMAEVGAFLHILKATGLVSDDLLETYFDFGALILLIGEGEDGLVNDTDFKNAVTYKSDFTRLK